MGLQVTAGGTQASNVIDVDYGESDSGEIPKATISVVHTDTNRSLFSPGAEVVISREDWSNPGTYIKEFTGVVQGKPSREGEGGAVLDVVAESRMAELDYMKVNRPFIEMNPGAIIREAVANTISDHTRNQTISKADSTTNWSSDAPIFELGQIAEKRLYDFGTDVLFVGWRENATGEYSVKYDAVSSIEAPDSRLIRVDVRMLVNNRGNVFSGELELRDHGGNSYVWDLDIPGYAGFKTYELPVEDADFDAGELSSNGELEFRFDIDSPLPEDRALAIDMVRTLPFSTEARDTTILTTGVEDTDRTVSLRFDGSVTELINRFTVEDDSIAYLDEDDVLHFESSGDASAPVTISYGTTNVVEADVNRDYDGVRNRVTVQGANDLQATFENTASIEFYGVAAREDPIIDKSIQSEDELEDRGRGFLRENAWSDSALKFVVADNAFRDVAIGDRMSITWAPEGIDGSFIVTEKTTTQDGFISLSYTGTTEA